MEECLQIFTNSIYESLKNRIVGRVFVTIESNDELVVEIRNYDDFTFQSRLDNLSERIVYGLSTNDVVDTVIGKYKSGLMKWFEHLYFK